MYSPVINLADNIIVKKLYNYDFIKIEVNDVMFRLNALLYILL